MNGLISLGGKLINIRKAKDKLRSIETEILTFNRDQERFESKKKFSFTLNSEIDVTLDFDIIKSSKCTEVCTGLEIIAVLFLIKETNVKRNNSNHSHRYCLLTLNVAKQTYSVLQKFTVRSKLTDDDVILTDGPTVLWKETLKLYVFSRKWNESLVIKDNVKSIMWCGVCYERNTLMVIGTSSDFKINNKTQTDSCIFFCPVEIHGDDTNTNKFDATNIVPREYTNIRYIHVVNFSYDKSVSQFVSEILAITSCGYVLRFINGELQFAVPTGARDKVIHQLVQWTAFAVDTNYISVHHGSDVLIIDTVKREVVRVWTDVTQVLLQDFVGCGCPQLLLLYQNFDLDQGWTLSDQEACLIDKKKGTANLGVITGVTDHKDDESNLDSVISALIARLQNELVLIHDKREEIEKHRKQFLVDNWNKLSWKHPTGQPSKSQASLVNLLNKCQSTAQKSSASATPSDNSDVVSSLSVGPVWQRIIRNRWVVGTTVKNNSDSLLKNIQVDLIPVSSPASTSTQHEIYCQSYFYPSPSHKEQSSTQSQQALDNPIKPKRLKKDNSPLSHCLGSELPPLSCGTALCVSDVPRFGTLSCFTCQVLVCWTNESQTDETQNSDLVYASKAYDRGDTCAIHSQNEEAHRGFKTMYGGTVSLKVTDVLQDKYTIIFKPDVDSYSHQDLLQDQLVLSALQQMNDLEVRSTWSNLRLFPEWLETLSGFTFHQNYKLYMPSIPALYGVRLNVRRCLKERAVSVTTYTWDTEQLYLLLQHLYSCLPDDIIILQYSDNQQALNEVKRSMIKELQFLSQIHNLFKGDNSSTETDDLPERDEKDHANIVNIRENFAKRKRSVLEHCESVPIQCTANNFIKQLEQYQRITDNSVAMLEYPKMKTD